MSHYRFNRDALNAPVSHPDKVVDNTTQGIIEYAFDEIEYETLGPVLISKNYNDTIWFTAKR